MVRITSILLVMVLLTAGANYVGAQEELTKEEWQRQITELTAKRNELKSRLDGLDSEISGVKAKLSELDAAIQRCKDETYALVEASDAEIAAFDERLKGVEGRVDKLSRMSDEELLKNRDELDKLLSNLDEMGDTKLGLLPEFHDRIRRLKDRITALQESLMRKEKIYVVGTWWRDRDCLWNIAKKVEIYDNPWRWPKIWQGNRDQIKDPDLIYPGQKLKIPTAGPLTPEEKRAADGYYEKKAAMAEEATE